MTHSELEGLLFSGGAARAKQSECPSAASLSAFADHKLPEDEAASVSGHIALCGTCDFMILRLRSAPISARSRAARKVVLRTLALAACTVIAVAIPAYRYAWRVPSSRPNAGLGLQTAAMTSRQIASPRVIELGDADTLRGETGGTASVQVPGHSGSTPILLRFWIPAKHTGSASYFAQITDAAGKAKLSEIPLDSCDRSGYCVLLCDPGAFAPGHYQLSVREAGADAARPYRFDVEMF